MKKLLLVVFLVLSLFGTAYGSGFQINEHGARAMAMGGAFTGLATDPSALFYNPAGLARLPGTHFMAGVTLIAPNSSFRGPSPEITEYKLDTKIFTPINFYATHQLTDELNAGIGVNNPYGLGTIWEDDWVGRFLAIETEIRTFFFTAALSYKLTDDLSIGAGVNYAYGDVIIRRSSPIVPDDATGVAPFDAEAMVNLEGDGTGIGFTAGILYQPIEQLSLGVSYRSEVNIDFEGDATSTAPAQFAASVPGGAITAPLTTPQNITFGVAVKAYRYAFADSRLPICWVVKL